MTFEQLHYFVEIYQLKSITSAAESLQISRQSLSAIISKLEKELNIQLFVRSINGVVPTEAGNSLYTSALLILEEQTNIFHNMNILATTHERPREDIYIKLSEALVTLYADVFLEKISSAFSWVNFYISAFTISENLTTFYKDSDVCIYCDNTDRYFKSILPKNEYYARSLYSVPLYIWIAKDSPLLEVDNITFHHLRKYPISILRNTLNGIDFSTFLHSNLLHTVSTKMNLKKNIKNFEHYTIDLPINKGHFIFEDIFDVL